MSFLITQVAQPGARDAGKRFWLYFSQEGGGWWQWGPKAWARRFDAQAGADFEDAILCAPKVGPHWAMPVGAVEVVADDEQRCPACGALLKP